MKVHQQQGNLFRILIQGYWNCIDSHATNCRADHQTHDLREVLHVKGIIVGVRIASPRDLLRTLLNERLTPFAQVARPESSQRGNMIPQNPHLSKFATNCQSAMLGMIATNKTTQFLRRNSQALQHVSHCLRNHDAAAPSK